MRDSMYHNLLRKYSTAMRPARGGFRREKKASSGKGDKREKRGEKKREREREREREKVKALKWNSELMNG